MLLCSKQSALTFTSTIQRPTTTTYRKPRRLSAPVVRDEQQHVQIHWTFFVYLRSFILLGTAVGITNCFPAHHQPFEQLQHCVQRAIPRPKLQNTKMKDHARCVELLTPAEKVLVRLRLKSRTAPDTTALEGLSAG